MRAEQVLDYQHALRDSLRTNYYREYLSGFLRSMAIKGGGRTLSNVGDDGGAPFADSVIRVLERACAFHVDEEMTPLIRHAAAGLREDMVWRKEIFPTDAGFLMYDDPLVLRELRQRNMRNTAVVWNWGAGPDGRTAGAWVTFYSRWDDPKDEVSVEMREQHGDQQMRNLGVLHINHVQFIPWGQSVGPEQRALDAKEAAAYALAGDPIETGAMSVSPLRDLYSTLALMGQTITVVSDEEVRPAFARRLGKKKIPARVVVIKLRRTEGSRQPGETMVEWAHRWVVRAHWRKQRYGPGLSQTRDILIAPFIKGPEGKPLHISDKVYDLRI